MIVINRPSLTMILVMIFSLISSVQADSPKESTFTVGSVSLPYSEIGDGETIVAIHGAVSDRRAWGEYIEPLSQSRRFISYTRRFYGTKPWPNGDRIYNASVHANDLAGLIRSLEVGPVHLIARSSGGYSAVIVAHKYPELVRSLVLWEPFVGNDLIPSVELDTDILEQYKAWGKGHGPAAKAAKSGDTRTAVEHFIEHVYELGAGGFTSLKADQKKIFYDNARTLSLLYSGHTTDKVTCQFLKTIATPTLVLRGSITAPGYAVRHKVAADCIPGSETAIINGVVHNGIGLMVEEISNLAIGFWDGLE